jgi:DNA-directed RNA polymerase subunit K/omega
MADDTDVMEPGVQQEPQQQDELPPAPPVTDRFLFVDIAALRAKQLRRGARPRLNAEVQLPLKAERIAMEEVRQRLVQYDLPALKSRSQESAA